MDRNRSNEHSSFRGSDRTFELDTLLHPANAFAHPMDVVRDDDLTLNEKRAILASWASDFCALEAAPELRMNPSGKIVHWDDIMDALKALDREAANEIVVDRLVARSRRGRWRDRSGGAPERGPCHL